MKCTIISGIDTDLEKHEDEYMIHFLVCFFKPFKIFHQNFLMQSYDFQMLFSWYSVMDDLK